MDRKLATIRTVREIAPIEGADAIELARLDGWQCVVKKGEFQAADQGVYFEIDSFLPIEPRFEFLRKSSLKRMNDEEGFRLKTIKLRGQLSQGLLLPLAAFPELAGQPLQEGANVTEALRIQKYEPPIPAELSGIALGPFPSFIPKTDAERIQNLPDHFQAYGSDAFEITEKLDGSSMTVYHRDGQLGVCSRNLELVESEANTLWQIVRRSGLDRVLAELGRALALQGELAGEGIQKNPLRIRGQRLFLFHVFDIDRGAYLTPPERRVLYQTLRQKTGSELLDHVPVIGEAVRIFERYPSMDLLLSAADGKSQIAPQRDREGLVFKSLRHPNVVFKALSNRYLLKNE